MNARTLAILVFVVAIVGLRLVLNDVANFAPIAAAGIFAAFYFRKYALAILVTLAAPILY